MRPTRTARLVLGLCGALFVAGVLALTVVPGILALAALLVLLHTRWAARDAFGRSVPRAERAILEPVLHQGSVVHVQLSTSPSVLAPGVRARFDDEVPAGLEPHEPTWVEGLGQRTYAARLSRKGNIEARRVRCRLTDRTALWEEDRVLSCPTSVTVLASRDVIEAGRRLARRNPLHASAKSPVGQLVRDLEFESIRDFSPGDRLRDVDWKRVALYRRLLTKTWEKELEATVLLLLDAGRTMRAKQSKGSKLDHATLLAHELAEAALALNYRVGYLAFDETGIVHETRASRDKHAASRLAETLGRVPAQIHVARRLDVGLPGDAPVGEDELDFLAALGGMRGTARRNPRPGMGRAVDRLLAATGDRKLFVVAFTDLETLPDATLQALARLRARDHSLVTVVLPGSRYLDPPTTPTARDLEAAYKEERLRARARAVLRRAGGTLVEVKADQSAAVIVDAAQGRAPRSVPT